MDTDLCKRVVKTSSLAGEKAIGIDIRHLGLSEFQWSYPRTFQGNTK
jgi:hypothetical protein